MTGAVFAGRFAGKVLVVTGAAQGIGRAVALRAAAEGGRVLLVDRADFVTDVAAEAGNGAAGFTADLETWDGADAAMRHAADTFGGIDILINNAALFTAAPIAEITRPDYDRIMAVNVSGTLFMMQAVARSMIARGKGGRIINMASQAGRRGEALVAVYCASKAAVISLTQSAGLNLIAHGINVNAIAPGVVDGEHWDGVDAFFAKYEGKAPGQKKAEVGAAVPFGRMGTAADLTGMAVFLASDGADYIVAQTYNVDGGNWLS